MPELPEVEVIKLFLEKKIIGLKIQKIQVLSAKSFLGNPNLAEGQRVVKVWRKAKMLGVDLSSSLRDHVQFDMNVAKQSSRSVEDRHVANAPRDDKGVTLLFHLKMSGQLIYISSDKRFIGGHPTPDMVGKMPNKHTRVIFSFSDGSHLYFNDQRKFGWVKVTRSVISSSLSDGLRADGLSERSESKDLKNLGPEPLEKGFVWQILKEDLLKHKNMPVKVAIMDQSVVSGVGNIYSNEACFLAKIDPRTKVASLTDKQFQALRQGIIESLQTGIKYGGSTRAHFVDPKGHKGYFLDYAYVYGRTNQPCKSCGGKVKKITLGGRGTYFCSSCQK